MAITSANQLELLQTAEAVAREKMIDPGLVVEAMEESLARAAKSRYGSEMDIRVTIDRKTGKATFTRVRTVVADDELENYQAEFTVEQAKQYMENPEIGQTFVEEVPPVDMGRIAAQSAKQVILQKVREAERDRQYEEFKDRAGTIINGQVKREEYGNVIVDVGRGEAVLRRNEKIGRESYRPNDRIRCYIKEVRREARGPQIFLSRTAPEFMAELFKMEVPEIYDGIIEIKAVARDPGSRAKIAVISYDSSIDPVGACVGMRGSRVQAVVSELGGEKIDIIPWSPDTATFVVNGLQPAEVTKVVMDEDDRRMEVVVPDDQLSLAIGRRGQNVRLASQLVGWDIDIMTETDESERRIEEMRIRSEHLMEALDVDDVLARLLVTEGFSEADEVAYVPVGELAGIDGLDEAIAQELQNRALSFVEDRDQKMDARRRELGVDDAIAEIDGLSPSMIVQLGEKGIKTLDDLGDLASDELLKDYLPESYLNMDEANTIIMAARAHWFDDEEAPAEETVEATEAEEETAS